VSNTSKRKERTVVNRDFLGISFGTLNNLMPGERERKKGDHSGPMPCGECKNSFSRAHKKKAFLALSNQKGNGDSERKRAVSRFS